MSQDTTKGPSPNPQESAMIYARLKGIHTEQVALRDSLLTLELEQESLFRRLREITNPQEVKRRPRLCHVCKRPTLEMFGDRPQCLRHVAGGDAAINDILARFLRT